ANVESATIRLHPCRSIVAFCEYKFSNSAPEISPRKEPSEQGDDHHNGDTENWARALVHDLHYHPMHCVDATFVAIYLANLRCPPTRYRFFAEPLGLHDPPT